MTRPATALALLLASLVPAAAGGAEVPLPPPPTGMTLTPPASTGRAYTLAFLGGFLAQGEHTSPSLQVDVGRDFTPPAWKRARLEAHLPVRVARPDWTGEIANPDPFAATTVLGTTEDTIWLVEAIPSGRLVLPVAPGFAVHVELGIGLAVTVERHVSDEMFLGRSTERSLVVAPSINAAAGLTYRLGERMDVVFQPVVLGRRAKADASTFSALWGLSYRL